MRNLMYISIIYLWILLSCIGYGNSATAKHGQVSSGTEPRLTWQFTYDDVRRITKILDPAGRQTKIHYELDDNKQVKVAVKELPDGSKVTYKFDNFGRRIGMTDTAGKVRYEYDSLDHLVGVERDGYPSISYSYDTLDRLKTLSVGEDWSLSYEYDFLGRLSRVKTPAGDISYDYQTGQMKVIRTLPSGVWTVWESQPGGRLKSITHVDGSNHVISKFEYAYRPDGLVSDIKEWDPRGGKIIHYEYDKVQRLITVEDSRHGKVKYSYDKLGNRTELKAQGKQPVAGTYDWAGRMLSWNSQACSHDDSWNLTSYGGSNGRGVFEFDHMNLLKSAKHNGTSIEYSYDGDGYLISRSSGAEKTLYVPDPLTDNWSPLLTIGSDGRKTFYIWESQSPLVAITGKEVRYFLHDHLGSVRCIADKKGRVTKRLDYSAFGVSQQNSSERTLVPGYAGLFFDESISMYLTRARAYDPQTGRFLQTDPQHRVPLGSQKDLSTYAYCGGDPLNFSDRSGSDPERINPSSVRWYDIRGGVQVGRQLIEDRITRNFQLMDQHSGSFMKTKGAWVANFGWQFLAEAFGFSAKTGMSVQTAMESIGTYSADPSQISIGEVSRDIGWAAFDVATLVGPSILKAAGGSYIKGASEIANISLSESFLFTGNTLKTIGTALETTGTLSTLFNTSKDAFNEWGPFTSNDPSGERSGSLMTPSNVGGIYLRGAGEAFKELGPLKGIAIDEKNGCLVLLGEGESKFELPPLRMDDVVTVFRSVYEHGEAPFVSIDPNPDNPKGPLMLTRHGKATQNTYVGWVLFEADRVMKAYSLGTDNITREKIESKIEGYQSLLEAGFFDSNETDSEPIWERFWIVPASVNQRESTKGKLTLFDVSLKVMTQRMVMKKGKLVPAPDDTPSPQAKAFAEWFADNYDQLSDEALSVPPEEVGVDIPVSFFWELRRVALVTAIAERLRDQGVPMPQWMRNYKVKECSLDPTTPAITVEATKKEDTYETRNGRTRPVTLTRTNRIYGGVNLAAADKNVHHQQGDAEADRLAPAVWGALSAAPLPVLTLVKFQDADKTYQAVAIPGDNTQDVGANRLEETDLVVPVLRGKEISLIRKYNSFFSSDDVFGGSWTLDLPRLEERWLPSKRTDDKITYSMAYQLVSPLNSYWGYFRKHQFVPAVKGKLLVPEKSGVFHGIADMDNKKIGYPTSVLLFCDGREWHFDDSGNFVAQVEEPSTVIYRRDSTHRVKRIEGWCGKDLYADIKIEYDKQGRMKSAAGSNEEKVEYEYADSGELKNVSFLSGNDKDKPQANMISYEYKDELVTAVAWNGKEFRRFEYGNRGKLVSESRFNSKVTYKVNPHPEGVTVTSSINGMSDSVEYDAAFRPLKRIFKNGTEVQWQYDDFGGREVSIKSTTGQHYTLKYSADTREAILSMPNGNTYSTTYDDAGRPMEHRLGNIPIVRQRWHANGLLASASCETFTLHPEYRKDMVLSSIMFTPPDNATSFKHWRRVQYNELGYPDTITDYSGSEIKIGYDKDGRISIIKTKNSDVQWGRDDKNRILEINTSWGYHQNNRYNTESGELEEINLTQSKEKARLQYDKGRLIRVQQYDGGEYSLSYYDQRLSGDRVKEIQAPNGLKLVYEYDLNNRLAAVNCGSVFKIEYKYDPQGRLTELAQVQIKR